MSTQDDFKLFPELPEGWLAPRKEICLSGIGMGRHIFAFEVAPLSITYRPEGQDQTKFHDISGAKCSRCDAILFPLHDALREHAYLHLAVETAREERMQALGA